MILVLGAPVVAKAQDTAEPAVFPTCSRIKHHAERNGLPPAYFARLIWKESRFDPNAVSPAGAEGIAQFMPGTAELRGLANSFDPEAALATSAAYLAEMGRSYGNLGLATAAYNGGEGRVNRWLANGGFLPIETEDFVLSITGDPADEFVDRSRQIRTIALEEGYDYDAACARLPTRRSDMIIMAETTRKPWAIQVAGNFRRSAAMASWSRVRSRHGAVVAALPVAVSRVRSPLGRRGIYAVRLGVDTRGEADRICNALRSSGGACIVSRN
jgi:hypothetical protein